MKKTVLLVAALLLVMVLVGAWIFLGPATAFSDSKKYLYIATPAANEKAVMDSLQKNELLKSEGVFNWLASRMGYWEKVKPGRYEIKKGTSLLSVVRMLRNGQQAPVNLVITKLRTPQDFARLVGRKFETDSAQMMAYLQSEAFKNKRQISADEAMAYVLPDTYTYFWNSDPEKIFQKLADASRNFWTAERKAKAEAKGFTPLQVAIIASIVDEESNALSEKDTIASVYMNRLKTGMPLQADPTVKYALQDFSLKRIYEKHLAVVSPYNTYRNRGLPPGPICTPQKKTIDAVLDAPQTNYVYFVASPAFNGTHVFSATYAEHQGKARLYQEALNRLMAQKQ
ncbi:UPF0755 protein [Cnuella takakiae]|uniref:Endolytic murein transglycosylase n=1 Tax=Cnuella takakiae TaxID=1302690 RepID=A0A1M5HE81_9BACT|nr:endolytic transglycosylase MltG [Cnuella takakiae]OLY92839.1 hypothetical protein BUE76_13795 [Cnuella takakiae]SHG14266.1 UPF0755 protein [Cnuella takakiae]